MSVVPFRWQGKTRSEQIRLLVEARTKQWLAQWYAGSDKPVVKLADAGYRPASSRVGERWCQLDTGRGSLSFRISNPAETWGSTLAGTRTADPAGLAAGIGARALQDLAQTLVGSAPDSVLSTLDMRPLPEALEARCGVVTLHWSLEQLRLDVHLDAGLCDLLSPREARDAEALTPRTQAIGSQSVELSVVLDLGEVGVAEAMVLQPGQILTTGIALDSRIRVRSPDGGTIFSGVLVAENGRKALRCVRN